jgi:dienelactone hydrolase
MKVSQAIIFGLSAAALLFIGFGIGFFYSDKIELPLKTPFVVNQKEKALLPLLPYTFASLRERTYEGRTIKIEKELSREVEFVSYLFTYDALGRNMSGQINFPTVVTDTTPVIVMIRGYVPHEIFSTGVGTKNGAAAFARAGFITIAPDFFGYGDSDPEPTDSWQARFEKPIAVIELIKTVREKGIPMDENGDLFKTDRVGLWGHSNGGQIAMSTLVTMRESIPTALWAPVVAPFPYSVLFFSDEDADEGKGMRLWVGQLEDKYELRDFSFTQYLDGLNGPFQLHHGISDEAAPKVWSDEFIAKVKKENEGRVFAKKNASASQSATLADPIVFKYFEYPGADHNLQPNANWQKVVERDIAFYTEYLKK